MADYYLQHKKPAA